MVKTVGKYDLYGTLGEGAFGKVKYAVNTETNEAVAIKILDKEKIQARNMGAQIKKEISIMKMISHHHVVAVKDVFATSAKIFIVLEFVGGGELFDKIASEGKLPEEKARFYFKQLVEGLEHCHERGICHRDLKPENLLLDTDGNLKISDFGFSTLNIGDPDGDGTARAELLHTTCGTPNYVAPEVLGKDGYDGKKADVWSCGVILYVLLAGYLPFDENTMAALFQKIKSADYEFPDWFTPEAKDLISKILVPDPYYRPKLSQLKDHPWMMKGDSGPMPITHTNIAAAQGAPPTINNPGPGGVVPSKKQPAQEDVKHAPPVAPVQQQQQHHQQQQEVQYTPPVAPAAEKTPAHTNTHANTTTASSASATNGSNGSHSPTTGTALPRSGHAPSNGNATASTTATTNGSHSQQEEPKAQQSRAVATTSNQNSHQNGNIDSVNTQAINRSTAGQPAATQQPSAQQQQHQTASTDTGEVSSGFFCCGGGSRKKPATIVEKKPQNKV